MIVLNVVILTGKLLNVLILFLLCDFIVEVLLCKHSLNLSRKFLLKRSEV